MIKVSLTVGRFQPLHKGHTRLINRMCEDFETVIVGVGSSQKSREKWDPWTFEERKQMLKNVYGDRIKIVQLTDLGTTEGTNDWADYVISKITKVGLPSPTDYFTGSMADARWYVNRFYLKGVSPVPNDNVFSSRPDDIRNFMVDGVFRDLHIIERSSSNFPPATDIRTFLELRSNDWKQWVPGVNWNLVETTFPEQFRVKG